MAKPSSSLAVMPVQLLSGNRPKINCTLHLLARLQLADDPLRLDHSVH